MFAQVVWMPGGVKFTGQKQSDRRPRLLSLIVRQVVQRGYDKQNRGDFLALSKMFARDGVFQFEGDTPFGGERRGHEAIRAWFEQVGQEFGKLTLTARDVAASGPPWNLRVIVRFSDTYQLISGETLENHGFQFLRITWGKVKEDRILVDLGVVATALELIENRKNRAAAPTGERTHQPTPRTGA